MHRNFENSGYKQIKLPLDLSREETTTRKAMFQTGVVRIGYTV